MLNFDTLAQAGGGNNMIMSLLPIILIFVVFWFLLIRPQQKRMKEHREMVANLKRNDKVLTNGGIYGKVTKVGEGDEVEVEIATDVKVKVSRSMVQAVINPKPASSAALANDGKRENPIKRLFGGR
jgi:preprotein translocase subunit YajC